MQIKLQRKTVTEEVVEVSFPIFYESSDTFENGASFTRIYRIDCDGKIWSVTKRRSFGEGDEYEFDADKINLESQLAQYLGGAGSLGYASTEADFVALVQEARAALAAFPA